MSAQHKAKVGQLRSKASLSPKDGGTLPFSPPILRLLGLVSSAGKPNANAARKIKQVEHLLNQLEANVISLTATNDVKTILEVGAGKGYLGILLAERWFNTHTNLHWLGIEPRTNLVQNMRATISELKLPRCQVLESLAQNWDNTTNINAVLALHACDSATDEAISIGLKHQSEWIAVVPCCQAEVAQHLKTNSQLPESWEALVKHPIHRREFGSHLTNVMRCLRLEASGYSVRATELVGWEHSMKNELIVAVRTHIPKHQRERAAKTLDNWVSALKLPQERFKMTHMHGDAD